MKKTLKLKKKKKKNPCIVYQICAKLFVAYV